MIGAIGTSANYGTAAWNSPLSIFSIVISSLVPGGLVWGQRKIGTIWLHNRNNPIMPPDASEGTRNEDTGVNETLPPLLGGT